MLLLALLHMKGIIECSGLNLHNVESWVVESWVGWVLRLASS